MLIETGDEIKLCTDRRTLRILPQSLRGCPLVSQRISFFARETASCQLAGYVEWLLVMVGDPVVVVR